MDNNRYFVGVDVGTGSARAALVSSNGTVAKTCVRPIQTWNPKLDHYEQSSEDIWNAICECVNDVIKNHPISSVCGIGFDATCSLVVLDAEGRPLTISSTGSSQQNIMLWMDHRSTSQTKFINSTGHQLLRFIGGKTSPEAQCPKMLWIKENLPDTWCKAAYFFDLPDYLTYRATGRNVRSLCSSVAKFNYDAIANGWSEEFFRLIGLEELCENDYTQIGGREIFPPGTPIGNGLTASAAKDLGLLVGTPVGASLDDAYAGSLSLFGCSEEGKTNEEDAFKSRMALICGTSTGHMSIFDRPVWAKGAWGPFKGVLFPELFVHCAGQSISGILLDYMINNHPAFSKLIEAAGSQHPQQYLNGFLQTIATEKGLNNIQELTKNFHVWPDFHGNRSPLDDPSMRGMISGLSMTNDVENLAITYLAFMQALSYGTRHILESMQRNGRPPFQSLIVAGGLGKNPLFVQIYADACAIPVLLPEKSEMVLLGAAILGARASGEYATLELASKAMAGKASVVRPRNDTWDYHQRKYKVFLKMMADQYAYKDIMTV